MVIELEKIIELENSNPEGYSLILSKINNFESKNEDVTTFLKRDAITHTKANRSKTFLLFDDESYNLLGYFTLAVKSVDYCDSVIKRIKTTIAGHDTDDNFAIFYLIGQLGRDKNLSKKGIGSVLLDTALKYLTAVQPIIGLRYCLVETKKDSENEKVIQFYIDNGFKYLQIDKTDKYQQMIAKLKP